MLRYFAVATAIVVAAILIALALPHRDTAERDEPYGRRVSASARPGGADEGRATAVPLAGTAPWALSALPDCFRQEAELRGPVAYVATRLAAIAGPRSGWRPIAAGTYRAGDCVLTIAAHGVAVARIDTHLQVPDARAFLAGNVLVLDRRADDAEDVRTYRSAPGMRPIAEIFAPR